MTIVGFNFTKIEVERKNAQGGKINISNNVSIKDVSEANLNLGSADQKAIKFEFIFESKYEPELGIIRLGGELILLEKKDTVEKILNDWKKDKKVEKTVMSNILNAVLSKCNVQALILSQEVNLPSPIPMPKVKMDQTQEKDKK